jgi:protein transport protein SEC24
MIDTGSLSKYSAGQGYYYPGFSAERDGEKFSKELAHCLVRETAWEAVMRVRCTKGMRLANFYGNFFLRGPDLLALPTCNADSTFAVEITHSDALLTSSTISVQAGLLYTNSGGERRIRVHTVCIPVTKRTLLCWIVEVRHLRVLTLLLPCCSVRGALPPG